MPTPSSPRALALSTLLSVEKGKYGNIAVDTVLKRVPMSDPDRHLYTALVYGVTERKTTLEFLLGKLRIYPCGSKRDFHNTHSIPPFRLPHSTVKLCFRCYITIMFSECQQVNCIFYNLFLTKLQFSCKFIL